MINRRQIGLLSLFLWVLASAAGWALTPCLLSGAIVFLEWLPLETPPKLPEDAIVFLAAIIWIPVFALLGAAFGVLQWLVLRRHIARASGWITATIVGLSLGLTASLGLLRLFESFAVLLVPGIVVGLLQRLVLKRHFERTWWWMLPSALSWPLSLLFALVSDDAYDLRATGVAALMGLVPGLMSGVTLVFISRKHKEDITAPVRVPTRRRFFIWALVGALVLVLIAAVILCVTRPATGRSPLLTLEGHTARVIDMAFSLDGALLVSASIDGTVRVWRAGDGTLSHILEHGWGQRMFSVAFSPGGETLALGALASAPGDATVKLWRFTDGTLLHTLPEAGHRVAFSPDGSMLACGGYQAVYLPPVEDVGLIRAPYFAVDLRRVEDGELIRRLLGTPLTAQCTSLVFSQDGAILAAGFDDGAVRLWRVKDGVLLHSVNELPGERYVALELYTALSPDGKTLASASNDGRIRFWRVDDGTLLHEIAAVEPVRGITFSTDGSTLVSASNGNTVRFWSVADGEPSGTQLFLDYPNQRIDPISRVVFSPDLKTMAIADWYGVIRVYSIEPTRTSTPTQIPTPTTTPMPTQTAQPTVTPIGSAGPTATTTPMPVPTQTRQPTATPIASDGPALPHLPSTSAWSPDGGLVASTLGSGKYEPGKPSEADVVIAGAGGVVLKTVCRTTYTYPFSGYGPAWSPDGRYLLVSSKGVQPGPSIGLYLVDVETGSIRPIITSLFGDIYPAWSPDGKVIAWSAYRDHNWRIWVVNADGSSPRQVTFVPGRTDWTPRWTLDGRIVYLSLDTTGQRQVRVVDPLSGADELVTQPLRIVDQRFNPWDSATSDALEHPY